jgi:ClpP class serine protease
MLKHALTLNRIFNTPLLISQDKLDILSTNVGLRLLNGTTLDTSVARPTVKDIPVNSKIAIIKVFDSLVSKGGAGESGFTSYEGITRASMEAINNGISKIGYYIDSPGGEANGAFALTAFLKSIPEKYGVETFSFSDGYMTSGAYAIASATQRIYATDSTTIGSIAAINALVDLTEADKQDGYKYTIIRSLSEKAIYNPHEAISQEVIDKATAKLTAISDIFIQSVSDYRPNLTIESIIALAGDTFLGKQSLELGLIDELVSSIDEVISLELKQTPQSQQLIGNTTMTLEELKTQLSAKDAELVALQASVTGIAAKAISDERTRCLDILTAGKTLKISEDQIIKRINTGTTKDDSLDIFTAIAEAVGTSTMLDTTISAITSTITETTPKDKIEVYGEVVSISEIIKAAKGVK